MTTNVGIEPYDILTEAEAFVKQMDNDEFEFTPEAENYSVAWDFLKDKKGKTTVTNALSISIAEFKKYKDLYFRMVDIGKKGNSVRDFMSSTFERPQLAVQIIGLATEIIQGKNLLRNHKLIKPGEKVFAERNSLREQLKEERVVRETNEQNAKASEAKIKQELASVNLAYTRLKKYIVAEMGEKLGHQYIQKAITKYDDNVWESEVEDASEDDKGG